ncbi:UNVERIFIED_CONTAM: hypothetical protein Sradi_3173700 [Sesamum radiatum]|uniref:Retrotransposon gag domain-containing protein n=1 Tax=Sesamum radiatum TaxID=300843 RepID=A0AAW2REQ4_SESRA
MIDEASRKALVEFERRTITPAPKKGMKRQLLAEREPEKGQSKTHLKEASSGKVAARPPGISKAKVDYVNRQIEKWGLEIDDFKRRGSQTCQNTMGRRIHMNHVAAFELVMNLYGQTDSINAKLFVTTLTGKAQEWFTNLPSGSIESFEQLVQKIAFYFASKKKAKRSTTHLFTIRQGEDETLKNFIGRFNNETLEVQDLRINMMVSILIHGLRKGPFASALAMDPPTDIE